MGPSSRAALCVGLASLLAWTGSSAQASTCADICPGTGACSFNTEKTVSPGSVLDCAGRDITIGGLGNLKVVNGGFKLIAKNVTVEGTHAASGIITAVEGAGGSPGSIELLLSGWLFLQGKLRANGTTNGGTIRVQAVGDITIPDVGTDGIEALGTALDADGGDIVVRTNGTLIVEDPILADGGGGESAGGNIVLRAGGNITTSTDGHISAYGRQGGGGDIAITAAGTVLLQEHVKAEGVADASDGGTVSIRADGSLAVANDISVNGAVNVSGGSASGGSVELSAGCGGISIASYVYATGGSASAESNGGFIDVESSGPVTVGAGGGLYAPALSTLGTGGAIDISSGGLVTIGNTAVIDARGGSSPPAAGGRIGLRACTVNVASGAVMDVRGFGGGSITLGASKLPPSSGAQPLVVSPGAAVRAAAGGGAPGTIRVTPLRRKDGVCSNGPACQLNSDCTIGCQTGSCLAANPDVAGVTSQFDIAPLLISEEKLPSCAAVCAP